MFKELANLTSLMRNAQGMGNRLQELQDELRQEHFSAQAAEGMIYIEVNGLGEVLRLHIDPELMNGTRIACLEAQIPIAMNQATALAKARYVQGIKSLIEGLNLPIPGLDQLISRFV